MRQAAAALNAAWFVLFVQPRHEAIHLVPPRQKGARAPRAGRVDAERDKRLRLTTEEIPYR